MSAPSHSSPPSGAHCSVVGLLDDGWSGLSAAARARIASAGCVIGAARTLERVAELLAVSRATAQRDVEAGKARLARELRGLRTD